MNSESYDVVIVGGAAVGSVGRLFPDPRSRLYRLGCGDRARPDLCARRHHAVGRLDPPAVLHAGKHPHEPLRRRVFPRSQGALRRGGRYRAFASAAICCWRARPARTTLRRTIAVQHAEGADIVLMDPAALAAKFPWLNASDLTLGAFGRRPAKAGSMRIRCSRCCAMRRAHKGARYIHGEVVGIERDGAASPA